MGAQGGTSESFAVLRKSQASSEWAQWGVSVVVDAGVGGGRRARHDMIVLKRRRMQQRMASLENSTGEGEDSTGPWTQLSG